MNTNTISLKVGVNGNVNAIKEITDFFEMIFINLSTRFFIDGTGKVESYVDPEVKRCLQNYVLSETNDFEMEG